MAQLRAVYKPGKGAPGASTLLTDVPDAVDLVFDGTRLYLTSSSGASCGPNCTGVTVRLDGSDRRCIEATSGSACAGAPSVHRLAVDESGVLLAAAWSSPGFNTPPRIDLVAKPNGVFKTLVTPVENVTTALATDGVAMYWAESLSGDVKRLGSGGGAPVVLAPSVGTVRDNAVDSTTAFVLTGDKLLAVPREGGAVTSIATGLGQGTRLALDADGVHVAVETAVVRGPKTGGDVVTVAKDQRRPFGITVDPDGVYWGNRDDGSVMIATRAR